MSKAAGKAGQMGLYSLGDHRVKTPASGRYWVAPNALVIGMVELEEDASVWFNTLIRGDNEPIRIGARTNIQEGSVLHTDLGLPMTLGPDCTVGHMALIHGCTIEQGCLISMGAIILNGARIGEECLIGAGALVPEGKEIPPRSVVLGTPGKVVRDVTDRDLERMRRGTRHYVANWQRFKETMRRQE